MTQIKFGTDGWRAIIAEEFTVHNVARVSTAVAEWLLSHHKSPSVVIGHDCRFGGDLFVETAIKVLVQRGIRVIASEKGFVSTPMVSYATKKLNASLGIVITASHNPPSYNGYKLKAHFGGPLSPDSVAEIEQMIPPQNELNLALIDLQSSAYEALVTPVDLEALYVEVVEKSFDLQAISSAPFGWAYDAMYGAGQGVMRRLFPSIRLLHCEENPSFNGQAPEPIAKNLGELAALMAAEKTLDCGLATDGDADRIGLFNAKGEFVDAHHIILIAIHYLVKYKGLTGKVVTAFSTTPRIKKMCQHYALEHEEVKIGFKYIASKMADPEAAILLGGEESGGIALRNFIPERDGVWMGLTIWECMAKTKKSLDELVDEVYAIVGKFAFQRNDIHLSEEKKAAIIEQCKNDAFHMFGKYKVQSVDTLDGYKYYFDDDRWLMIRPSGTEPVLRIYAEAPTSDEANKIIASCQLTIGA